MIKSKRLILYPLFVFGLCGIFSIVILLFIIYQHQAKAAIGISITPLKYDITANPGDVIHKVVTAVNPNDFPIYVVPEFQDFKLEEKGITFIPPEADNPWKMSDWIKIQTEPILLESKQYYDLPFSVIVPKNAGAGGHYAAVFFKVVDKGGGTGFGAVPRVGALILLNIAGEIHKTGEFVSFKVPFFYNKGPVVFEAKFKNTGTAHYDIQAKVNIYNFLGFKKYEASSDTRFITPDMTRPLKAEWVKTWPIGVFKATAVIADGEGKAYAKTVWFIGFPWVWFSIGVGILAVLYTGFRIVKKKFKIVRA